MILRLKTELFIEYMRKNNLNVKGFCKLCNITEEDFENIMYRGLNLPCGLFFNISLATKIRSQDMYEIIE